MKKICIVAGARPNFIKVAPVIRAIRNAQEAGNEISYQLVYTGKEDDPTLESSLFDDLGIQKPDAYLGVDCPNMNELTGQVMGQFWRLRRNRFFLGGPNSNSTRGATASALLKKNRGVGSNRGIISTSTAGTSKATGRNGTTPSPGRMGQRWQPSPKSCSTGRILMCWTSQSRKMHCMC